MQNGRFIVERCLRRRKKGLAMNSTFHRPKGRFIKLQVESSRSPELVHHGHTESHQLIFREVVTVLEWELNLMDRIKVNY